MAVANPSTCAGVACGSSAGTTTQKRGTTIRLRLRWPIYTRTWNTPQNKFKVAPIVKNMAQIWASLPIGTIEQWYNFGQTRDPLYDCIGNHAQPSAWQAFLSTNVPLIFAGQAAMTAPPASYTATTLTSATWEISGTGPVLKLLSVSTSISINDALIINASAKQKTGTTAIPKSIGRILTGAPGQSTNIDFTAAWLAKHGSLKSGDLIAVEVRLLNLSNGAYSPSLKSLQRAT
jgi:hypothetical protein